ncbi:hypothetical protein STAQ_21360 [Allostella sp. ATCC 35155]|nr:hypothetical protein STAQ_21360 [Stella sp. ATCC 35155]
MSSTAARRRRNAAPGLLVDAADEESKLVLCTATALAGERIDMKEFNKKFPGAKVDIVRACLHPHRNRG